MIENKKPASEAIEAKDAEEKPAKKTTKTKEPTNRQIKITLSKSLIGRPEKHRRVAKALGLTKSNDTVVRFETPTIMGMVKKISHLLTVEVA